MTAMEPQKSKSRNLMWPFSSMSLETASLWFGVANGALLFSLLLGVISTFALVRLANVKEHHWDVAREKSQERMKQLDAEIAGANAQAEQAKAESARAQLALVEYRKSRAEKVREHLSLIIKKLKEFPDTKFDIGLGPEGFREQWDFSWQLEPAFPQAGWKFVEWTGIKPPQMKWSNFKTPYEVHAFGLANVVNVSLEMHPSAEAKLEPAARALADALASIGITATVGGNNNPSTNNDVLHVLIGEKQ